MISGLNFQWIFDQKIRGSGHSSLGLCNVLCYFFKQETSLHIVSLSRGVHKTGYNLSEQLRIIK